MFECLSKILLTRTIRVSKRVNPFLKEFGQLYANDLENEDNTPALSIGSLFLMLKDQQEFPVSNFPLL